MKFRSSSTRAPDTTTRKITQVAIRGPPSTGHSTIPTMIEKTMPAITGRGDSLNSSAAWSNATRRWISRRSLSLAIESFTTEGLEKERLD